MRTLTFIAGFVTAWGLGEVIDNDKFHWAIPVWVAVLIAIVPAVLWFQTRWEAAPR